MSKKKEKPADLNAEQKIKEAARRLFTQKGYAAVKTRDIAAEAGINLALLNYYFRSKEKLFDIIMLESLHQFMNNITLLFQDDQLSMEQKIEILVDRYIDMLLENPNLPLFILSEIGNNPKRIRENMETGTLVARARFMKEFTEQGKKQKGIMINPAHLMANMIGLTVFPFAAAPILQQLLNIDKKQFQALMLERKKLIPLWLKMMMLTPVPEKK